MGKNQYSPTMRNKVASEIARGRELTELAGEEGFPARFSTLWKWHETRPEFREAVDGARAFHARAALHQMVAVTARLSASDAGVAAAIAKGFGAMRMAAEKLSAGDGGGVKALPDLRGKVKELKIIQVVSGVPDAEFEEPHPLDA